MYQVLDNGRPADCFHCAVDPSWNNSKFETLAEAVAYAREWLGAVYSGVPLKVGIAVNYSGYGDTIEIREVADGPEK